MAVPTIIQSLFCQYFPYQIFNSLATVKNFLRQRIALYITLYIYVMEKPVYVYSCIHRQEWLLFAILHSHTFMQSGNIVLTCITARITFRHVRLLLLLIVISSLYKRKFVCLSLPLSVTPITRLKLLTSMYQLLYLIPRVHNNIQRRMSYFHIPLQKGIL